MSIPHTPARAPKGAPRHRVGASRKDVLRRAKFVGVLYAACLAGCLGTIEDDFTDDDDNVFLPDDSGTSAANDASDARDAGATDSGRMEPGGGEAGAWQPNVDAGPFWGDAAAPPDTGVASDGGGAPDAAAPVDASTPVDAAPPTPNANEVPSGAHCDPVRDWDPAWSQFEEEVLRLTNEARAVARTCGANGSFNATTPVTMEPRLRCSSRLHSLYMVTNNEFSHDQSQTGLDPFERMKNAGYQFRAGSENIAAGQRTPADVVKTWIDSPGHCANIMSPRVVHLGVGYLPRPSGSAARYSAYWTQNFGAPL